MLRIGLGVSGIIPAHAGNTARMYRPDGVQWGSSPHMRGTLQGIDVSNWKNGIIPAHAGNTKIRQVSAAIQRDHPRTCGEHSPVMTMT